MIFGSFKPQRAASSIPTSLNQQEGRRHLQFQTPTGRLIHSNGGAEKRSWQNPTFQTPTGRLIHSNLRRKVRFNA